MRVVCVGELCFYFETLFENSSVIQIYSPSLRPKEDNAHFEEAERARVRSLSLCLKQELVLVVVVVSLLVFA